MAATVSDPAPKKAMLIVPAHLKLKNVKTPLARMLFLERSGNAAARNP
jgi:hypothetical protein